MAMPWHAVALYIALLIEKMSMQGAKAGSINRMNVINSRGKKNALSGDCLTALVG
jgi:hypothetical protein